jgi:hypothetical protein
MKAEKEFFVPYIAGRLGNSLQEAEALQNKLDSFQPKVKVVTM